MAEEQVRVRWKYPEWDLVIMELYRTHPISMTSSTLVGIKEQDMTAAMMQVLPPNRWRKSMNMILVRPMILERLKELKVKIKHEEEEQKQALKNAAASKIDHVLVDLYVQKIFERLQPMLDQYVKGRLSLPPDATEPVFGEHKEKEKKGPRVCVIGLLPIQENEMVKEFPGLDFSFIGKNEKSQEIRARCQSVDAIFGLTAKMGRTPEDVIKSMNAVDRYHRVSGNGTSAMKRDIKVWMHARQQH